MPQPWQIQLFGHQPGQDEGKGARKPYDPWLQSPPESLFILSVKNIALLPPLQPEVPGLGAAGVPWLRACTINPFESCHKSAREQSSSGEVARGVLTSFVWNISIHSRLITSLVSHCPFLPGGIQVTLSASAFLNNENFGLKLRCVFSTKLSHQFQRKKLLFGHLPRSGGNQRKRNLWGRGMLQPLAAQNIPWAS